MSDSGTIIRKSEILGAPILVTPSGEGPVTVGMEAAASAFEHHHPDADGGGYREWEAAGWLGKLVDTHPQASGLQIVTGAPMLVYGVPNQGLALGEAAVLDLPSVFAYFIGEAAYAVRSSDPTVASAQVDGGLLTVRANATGAATVTVVATGRNGRRMERRFTVTGLAPSPAAGAVGAPCCCNSIRRPGTAMNPRTPHARRRRLMLGMKPFRKRPGAATPGSGPSSPGRA